MRLHVLASGSSGNSYCIETGTDFIFIDIGVPLFKVKEFFSSVDREDKNISLFITHEHTDHINGIVPFVRNYAPKIYTSPLTAARLCKNGMDDRLFYPLGTDSYHDFNTFGAVAFDVSHDAVQPFGYIIMTGAGNVGFVTDLGCITRKQVDHLEMADMLVLEANHDIEMLKKGKYPAYLKRRIASHKGHLSNNDAMALVASLQQSNLNCCLFAHVSEENNDYELLEKLCVFCQSQYDLKAYVLRQQTYTYFDVSCRSMDLNLAH